MNFQDAAHLAHRAAQAAKDSDTADESVELLALAVAALAMAMDNSLRNVQQDISRVEHQVRSR